ncbi:MAG: acetyl-CoA carboxylase biotin carboxyl carrier protein [Bacteroidota bacterium]
MELKEIQNLIKFVAKSGASEVALEMDDIKITIKTGGENVSPETTIVQQIPMAAHMPAPQATPAPVAVQQETPGNATTEEDDSKYIAIKSPIIGTFYRKPSPDKPTFVNVGDEISEGSVVCIIEAMKLFNEIESEVSGRVVKVLVDDNTPVEYDQPLYLVDPS